MTTPPIHAMQWGTASQLVYAIGGPDGGGEPCPARPKSSHHIYLKITVEAVREQEWGPDGSYTGHWKPTIVADYRHGPRHLARREDCGILLRAEVRFNHDGAELMTTTRTEGLSGSEVEMLSGTILDRDFRVGFDDPNLVDKIAQRVHSAWQQNGLAAAKRLHKADKEALRREAGAP